MGRILERIRSRLRAWLLQDKIKDSDTVKCRERKKDGKCIIREYTIVGANGVQLIGTSGPDIRMIGPQDVLDSECYWYHVHRFLGSDVKITWEDPIIEVEENSDRQ